MCGKRRVRFLNVEIRQDFKIDNYRPYFEEYSQEKWASETNGAVFDYQSSDGKSYQCVVTHCADYGFAIHLYVYLDKKYVEGWITVGDINRINEKCDVGSDEIFYVGNFVKPDKAWEILSAYLTSPMELPPSKMLHNFNDLPENDEKFF